MLQILMECCNVNSVVGVLGVYNQMFFRAIQYAADSGRTEAIRVLIESVKQ